MTDFTVPADLSQIEAGLVIDQVDVDSKLTRLRMHGTPAFTGRDMEDIEAHYGKGMSDLTVVEMQVASAWVYLRRWGKGRGRQEISWDEANDVLVEIITDEAPDPTGSGASAPSPPSATTGE